MNRPFPPPPPMPSSAASSLVPPPLPASPPEPSLPSAEPPLVEERLLIEDGPPPEPTLTEDPAVAGDSWPLRSLLPWLTCLLALLAGLQYFVPYLLEQYQYALVRGKQRAEYEGAAKALESLSLDKLSRAYQLISQKVGPSVVHIQVTTDSQAPASIEEWANYRGAGGQGSGVIVDSEGYIVTNYHVIHGARHIRVSLSDGRRVDAEVRGYDAPTDLAVLKIDAPDLFAAEWGDSSDLRPGAMVWALGSPFGLERSITFGIVSAKHRSKMGRKVYQDFLQTDAAVNPGNSGGPLVDVYGRVVGVNTAIVGDAYQGISFAIPSSVAQEVYQRLKESGRVARGWLGVRLGELDLETAQRMKLPDRQGALVDSVVQESDWPSPALAAGMQPGDVILVWNHQPVKDNSELIRMVAMTEIGAQVPVVVQRKGNRMELSVEVAEKPAETFK